MSDTAVVVRFMAKVHQRADGCWEWLASRNDQGYGGFALNGKWMLAHRVSYRLFRGDPGEWDVLHYCDRPWCVAPECLWLGDDFDNAGDRERKGRGVMPSQPTAEQRARGVRHGRSVLTPEIATVVRQRLPQASVAALSRELGVSRSTIARVRDGVSYV